MRAPASRSGRSFRAVLSLSFALGLLGSSCLAHADEPVAPEADTNPNVFPQRSAQPNLILVGAAVTAGWYGVAVGTSYLWPNSDASKPLRIPVAGPYMALGQITCASRESNCNTFSVIVRTVFTSLSLVGQTGGVLAMLEGAFLRTQPAASESAVTGARAASSARALHGIRWSVAPAVVGDRAGAPGLGVFGAF
jgi:hypothetical protein